jgi:hypothetical protein
MERTNIENKDHKKHKRGKNKNRNAESGEPKPRVDNYIIAQNIKNEKFEHYYKVKIYYLDTISKIL